MGISNTIKGSMQYGDANLFA